MLVTMPSMTSMTFFTAVSVGNRRAAPGGRRATRWWGESRCVLWQAHEIAVDRGELIVGGARQEFVRHEGRIELSAEGRFPRVHCLEKSVAGPSFDAPETRSLRNDAAATTGE